MRSVYRRVNNHYGRYFHPGRGGGMPPIIFPPAVSAGWVMGSLAGDGGLAGIGGLAGVGGGLVG